MLYFIGHKIQEIRERALFHIISKLSDGYTFENDVGKSRELLAHLFRWFLFEPCTHEVHVLNLIRKLIVVSYIFGQKMFYLHIFVVRYGETVSESFRKKFDSTRNR